MDRTLVFQSTGKKVGSFQWCHLKFSYKGPRGSKMGAVGASKKGGKRDIEGSIKVDALKLTLS